PLVTRFPYNDALPISFIDFLFIKCKNYKSAKGSSSATNGSSSEGLEPQSSSSSLNGSSSFGSSSFGFFTKSSFVYFAISSLEGRSEEHTSELQSRENI